MSEKIHAINREIVREVVQGYLASVPHFTSSLTTILDPANSGEGLQWVERLAIIMNRLQRSPKFEHGVTAAIIVATVLSVLDANQMGDEYVINIFNTLLLIIFAIECVVKILACGYSPELYFEKGWNIFDFIITMLGFLEFADLNVNVLVLRSFRLLRILRTVRALPAYCPCLPVPV